MTHEKVTRRNTRHEVTLDASDVRRYIREKYKIDVHPEAKVFVRVPGGGDWSNMDLDIRDSDQGDEYIRVRWEVAR